MPQQKGKIKLIVNADDFGRAEGINRGIDDGFTRGIVSSASLVANGPAFSHAVTIAHRTPQLGVGIHLTLTEYPSLLKDDFLMGLSSRNLLFTYFSLLHAGSRSLQVVKEELRLQIEKVIAAGIVPTHLDSHGHVHIHPRLFPIILDLAEHYHIKWIRMPQEGLAVFTTFSYYIQKCVVFTAASVDRLFVRGRINFPGYFHGLSYVDNLNQERLKKILGNLRPGLNELMCHIGSENEDPPFFTRHRWADELQTMKTFSKKELEREMGIYVVSYRDGLG